MLGLCQLKLNQWKSVGADLFISFEFQWLREWWYRGEIWSACARRQQLVVGGGWYKGRARRSHRLVTSRRPTLLVPPASPIFLQQPWWVITLFHLGLITSNESDLSKQSKIQKPWQVIFISNLWSVKSKKVVSHKSIVQNWWWIIAVLHRS